MKVLTYVRDNALQSVAIHVNETNKSVRVSLSMNLIYFKSAYSVSMQF